MDQIGVHLGPSIANLVVQRENPFRERETNMQRITLIVGAFCLTAGVASAVPINYGTLNGTQVQFQNVTEDSTTDPSPLFGVPTVAGNSLIFNPTAFGAFAGVGSPTGSVDTTDGTLLTTIMGINGGTIDQIVLSEAGDYTLLGAPGDFAQILAQASVFIRVIEIDGVSVNPINVFQDTLFPGSLGFNQSLPGGATALSVWNGSKTFDIAAALASQSISGSATKVTFSLDNSLSAMAFGNAIARVQKKEQGVRIDVIPAPGTIALISLGGLVATRRRR